jgi:hypothetical protein
MRYEITTFLFSWFALEIPLAIIIVGNKEERGKLAVKVRYAPRLLRRRARF